MAAPAQFDSHEEPGMGASAGGKRGLDWGQAAEERGCLPPKPSVIIGTLPVAREVKPFALGFFGRTQAQSLVDHEIEDRRTDA